MIRFFKRFKFRDAYALAVILILTGFSIAATWPGQPERYLPNWISWPQGGGVRVGDWERADFRLGLDLNGGVSITLEASGQAARVRRGESLDEFIARENSELDSPISAEDLISRNPALEQLAPEDYDRPLPEEIEQLILPLDADSDALSASVEEARRVIEERVNGFGVSEAEVTIIGDTRINAQIPGVDADQASELVGSTALLEFRELDIVNVSEPGPVPPETVRDAIDDVWVAAARDDPVLLGLRAPSWFVPDPSEDVIVVENQRWLPATGINEAGDTVQLTGRHLLPDSITRTLDQGAEPALEFELDDEGARLMEQITRRLQPQNLPLGIFVDGELVSSPGVQGIIVNQGVINGLDEEDAVTLRRQLRAGALPINLRVLQNTEVAATLGEDSVVETVQAGAVAFLAIVVFMIIYYRVPGLLAALALIVYGAGVLATFKLVPITLTLAGVAGLVLSIGFAVDGNVLIFERLKEELRLGRSLQGAVDTAWARAWPAIRDANVSTLITVAVLWLFADALNQNLIKSFALALLVGTGFSFVTVMFVTRTFMNLAVSSGINPGARSFGVRRLSIAAAGRGRRGGAEEQP